MLIHKEIKAFKCHLCNKSFRRSHHMKTHLLHTHTQEKPLKCDVCEKAFKTTRQIQSHSIVHSNARKYQCLVCKKAYPHQTSLQYHMNSHDRTKLLCYVCLMSFCASNRLTAHILKHHE